jgi:hypothetical protein
MDPISWDKLVILLAATSFAMFLAHWIPTGPKTLDKIERYTVGVSIIMSGLSIYLIWIGNALTAAVCWAFAIAGGVPTVLGYRWDDLMNELNQAKAAREKHAKKSKTDQADA